MKFYGALNLTESSPPQSFREPIPLDMAKEFLHVTQTNQDRTISEFITAARAQAEIMQNRDLVVKQWDFTLDQFVSFEAAQAARSGARLCEFRNEIPLRQPLRSVDLIEYREFNGQTSPFTNYYTDLARGLVTPSYGFAWPFFTEDVSSSVLIRFQSGYPIDHPFWADAGARVLVGMKMLITGWYEDRIPYADSRGIVEVPFGISKLLGAGAKQRAF